MKNFNLPTDGLPSSVVAGVTTGHAAMHSQVHALVKAIAAAVPDTVGDLTDGAALKTSVAGKVNESDFLERVQDAVAAMLAAGTGVTVTYDDAAGKLTLTSSATGSATDPEVVRDTIGVALAGVGLISVVVNDAADTITISTTATANSTDAQLRDRGTHTGTQAISTITGLQAALDAKAPVGSTGGTGGVPAGVLRLAAAQPDAMAVGTITVDSAGAALSFGVVWPDDATGTYTGVASTAFPGSTDSYTVTHVLAGVTTTYTQPAVTRNSNGFVTARPAITVA